MQLRGPVIELIQPVRKQVIHVLFLLPGSLLILFGHYARFESPSFAKTAGLVECAGLAGSLPESDDLCSVVDDYGQIASACPGGRLCGLAVPSHPSRGAASLRNSGVALDDFLGMESGRVGFDGADDVIPVRRLVRHHC